MSLVSVHGESMLEVMIVGGAMCALVALMVFEKWSSDRKSRREE